MKHSTALKCLVTSFTKQVSFKILKQFYGRLTSDLRSNSVKRICEPLGLI